MMRTFGKRIARLEQWLIPERPPRILIRFEGTGSERLPQPTRDEIDEGWPMVIFRLVSAKESQMTPGNLR